MDDLFPFPADADAPQIPPDLSLPMYGRSTSLFQGLLAKILPSSPGKIRDQLSICVQGPPRQHHLLRRCGCEHVFRVPFGEDLIE